MSTSTGLALTVERLQDLAQQVVVVRGEPGLGQDILLTTQSSPSTGWMEVVCNGNAYVNGYLAGFDKLFRLALKWCDTSNPTLIAKHEQSLKRLLPHYESRHFEVPKDLTHTSSRSERTRFFHHEYQNKLLVGAAEFLLDYVQASKDKVLLKIDCASSMSPTALSLLDICTRKTLTSELMRFVLFDYERQLFLPQAACLELPPYSYRDMAEIMHLEKHYSLATARRIYKTSRGNMRLARAVITCIQANIRQSGYLDVRAMVDLYLATRSHTEREVMLSKYIADDCTSDDYIHKRNYDTFCAKIADQQHLARHRTCMAAYRKGTSPLVLIHALSIKDKYKRLETLAEPSEALKDIGLYDTWFSFFAESFADSDLRRHGTGDDPANAALISGAFILYSLGCGAVSSPFLEEFRTTFPNSKYIPTALYAQSMTYGRYLQPVDLPLAEKYALLNLETISKSVNKYGTYDYMRVFAENAYAYIKARNGKFDEALRLCVDGNRTMLAVYGEDKFKLHRSILIYNTSQIYELLNDYDRAEQELRLAILCDPYYGEYYNDFGNLLSKIEGREDEALDSYATAISLCPPYHEAHLNRGMLLAKIGRIDAAFEDFARALEIKRDDWRAFFQMGILHLDQGSYGDALRSFQNALEIEEGSADLLNNTGLAFSELGQSDKSIEQYRAAILFDARHAASHNNLSVELFNLGQRSAALEHAIIAVEIGGDSDYARNLAMIRDSE